VPDSLALTVTRVPPQLIVHGGNASRLSLPDTVNVTVRK